MSVSEKKAINRQFERVSAEDVRRAAEYQAAILADVAGRRGTLHGPDGVVVTGRTIRWNQKGDEHPWQQKQAPAS